MSELKFINIITPEREHHRSTLGYHDGGDRLRTIGNIPHGAEWVPSSRADRDRLVKWLRALDYSKDSALVAAIPPREY